MKYRVEREKTVFLKLKFKIVRCYLNMAPQIVAKSKKIKEPHVLKENKNKLELRLLRTP